MSNDTNSSPIISDLNHAIIALREVISQLSDPDKMSLDRRFQQQREEQLRLLEEVEKRLKAEMLAQTIGMPTHSAIGTLIDADLAVRGVKSAKEIYDRVDRIVAESLSDVITEKKLNKWIVGIIATLLFGGGGTLGTAWNLSFEARMAMDSIKKIQADVSTLQNTTALKSESTKAHETIEILDRKMLSIESGIKEQKQNTKEIDEIRKQITGINSRIAAILQRASLSK